MAQLSSSFSASFERLEIRQLMAASLRSIDGTGNNLSHLDWGSTDETLLRLAPASYADGIAAPAGAARPSARAISNAIVDNGDSAISSARHLSAFAYLWGQFIDHDLDLTKSGSESFNINVPTGDPYFDPSSTGSAVIPFTRSLSAGTVAGPRQQANTITAFIDASMVYGSDAVRATALRTLSGGKMNTSSGNLLPFNTTGLANDTIGGPASAYFLAGDTRANENIELTSIQTLFVREHNRLAARIAQQNPGWTDEQIYQSARKLVGAEIQMITYNEFLPALLGDGAIRPYSGYRSDVNPNVSTEFSTAAFRFGHSMLNDDVEFFDNNAHETRDELSLSQAFFNPAVVSETGIDPMLKYVASTNSEEIDTKVVDSLRNFLFGPPGAGGFDLASLNIQRGRDHGLSDYNSTRAALGLSRVTTFSQITSDVQMQHKLQSLYGSVNNIDLWVGGLAEDHVRGSSLGATFQRIVADQFTRTRDGDRFWFQNSLTPQEMQMVGGTTLSSVIQKNTTINNLQPNVFVFNVEIVGRIFGDGNGDGIANPRELGLGNLKVDLLDTTGTIVQTTRSKSDGSYVFSGVQVGDYSVRAELAKGSRFTTPPPKTISVTKGERFDRIDFGEQRIGQQPQPPRTASNALPSTLFELNSPDVLLL